MTRLGALGCAGFILSRETLDGDHAQACVDVARMLGTPTPAPAPISRRGRGGAKVGGAVGTIEGDDKLEH